MDADRLLLLFVVLALGNVCIVGHGAGTGDVIDVGIDVYVGVRHVDAVELALGKPYVNLLFGRVPVEHMSHRETLHFVWFELRVAYLRGTNEKEPPHPRGVSC